MVRVHSIPIPRGGRNVDPGRCRACDDCCCTRSPGLAVPADFGINRAQVVAGVRRALATGQWVVFVTHVWDVTYSVRPRHSHDGDGPLTESTLGACVMLGICGCSLAPNRRPAQCRSVTPGPHRCRAGDGFRDSDVARKWASYEDDLEALVSEAEEVDA